MATSIGAILLLLSAVSFRDAFALSAGAPLSACSTLTQVHPGVTVSTCTDCPFNVSLVAIDGDPVSSSMYRCGSQHTLRLESSGATFRGLAVQVREATQSFNNSAEFVGQFVNPPADGDWRIWDCNSPSATHPNANDKTSVDLTWEAPGDPTTSDVTVWFAITRTYLTVHAQLKGPTLSPDPAFCAPPVTTQPPVTTEPETPQELVLNFINNSPRVSGGNLTADILFSRPVESLRCALSGGAYQDCSSGSVTFVNVPPRDENNRVYFLRVVGVTADGVRTVIRRAVRVEEEGFCLAHFINDGVTVDGTTATVEFDGVGNFNTFLCDLDRQGLEQCSSPQVYTNLSAGNHRVKVVPNIAECGRNRRARLITFAV